MKPDRHISKMENQAKKQYPAFEAWIDHRNKCSRCKNNFDTTTFCKERLTLFDAYYDEMVGEYKNG